MTENLTPEINANEKDSTPEILKDLNINVDTLKNLISVSTKGGLKLVKAIFGKKE